MFLVKHKNLSILSINYLFCSGLIFTRANEEFLCTHPPTFHNKILSGGSGVCNSCDGNHWVMRSKVPSCLAPPAYQPYQPYQPKYYRHTHFCYGENTFFQVMCLCCAALCWVLSHRDKSIVLQLWHLTSDLVRPTFHGKLRSHTHRIISTLIQISTKNNIYTELGIYTIISTLMQIDMISPVSQASSQQERAPALLMSFTAALHPPVPGSSPYNCQVVEN